MDELQDKKRTSYTLYEKRKAVEKVQEIGVRGASRELIIPRMNLQRWSKQTELLEEAALNHDSRVLEHKYPLLEEALMIKEEREKRNVVTGKKIRRKAIILFQNLYFGDKGFKASPGWFRRMIKRNILSFRRLTSMGAENTSRYPPPPQRVVICIWMR